MSKTTLLICNTKFSETCQIQDYTASLVISQFWQSYPIRIICVSILRLFYSIKSVLNFFKFSSRPLCERRIGYRFHSWKTACENWKYSIRNWLKLFANTRIIPIFFRWMHIVDKLISKLLFISTYLQKRLLHFDGSWLHKFLWKRMKDNYYQSFNELNNEVFIHFLLFRDFNKFSLKFK